MHAGKHGYGVGQGAADDAWCEDIDSGSPYIQAVVGYQTEGQDFMEANKEALSFFVQTRRYADDDNRDR